MTKSDQMPHEELPLVSIATPSYNAMPYISDTVRSVQEQDYGRIEHIVMDGGSTDGTVEFLKNESHLNWTSESDRGQSHALNKCMKEANGEVVGWLNADDVYRPGAISSVVQFFRENDDVGLVYGDLEIIDEKGDRVGLTRSRSFILEDLLDANYIKQPTVFMRRSVWEEFKGVNESLHYTMDWDLWLRIGMAGTRFHYLKGEILAAFRLCPGTKSFDDAAEFPLEWCSILEKLSEAELANPALKRRRDVALRKSMSQYHLTNVIEALEKRNRKRVFDELFKAIRQDPALIFNRGSWKFAGMGVLGAEPDKLRKFRKNA